MLTILIRNSGGPMASGRVEGLISLSTMSKNPIISFLRFSTTTGGDVGAKAGDTDVVEDGEVEVVVDVDVVVVVVVVAGYMLAVIDGDVRLLLGLSLTMLSTISMADLA